MEVCGEIHVSQDRNQCQTRVNMGCMKLLYYVNMIGNRTPTMTFIYCTVYYTWIGRRVSTLQGHPYCPAVIEGSYLQRQPASTAEGTEYWKQPPSAAGGSVSCGATRLMHIAKTTTQPCREEIWLSGDMEQAACAGNRKEDTKNQALIDRTGLPWQWIKLKNTTEVDNENNVIKCKNG